MSNTHELKVWPEYWAALQDNTKTFEVRKLDRLFGKGDILHLREWSVIRGYSGREVKKQITYVMVGGKWGLAEGNCILGIHPIIAPPVTNPQIDAIEKAQIKSTASKEAAIKFLEDAGIERPVREERTEDELWQDVSVAFGEHEDAREAIKYLQKNYQITLK